MRIASFSLFLVACGSEPSAPSPDAAPAPVEVACTDLAATWTGGTARCQSNICDVSACTRGDTSVWETVEPATRDARYATARCNDGTPFDFDVRLAATPTNEWVIHLAGGGFCDDNAHACSERQVVLTTTSTLADRALSTPPMRGILSRDAAVNPAFANANHVAATYCSSDFWAGATTERRPTTGSPEGWYFSGRANVAAMLAILAERYGLAADAKVLVSGSSAGAFGVHFNAATFVAALPNAKLFPDAGWMTDWTDPSYTIGDATVLDLEVWTRARALWGATFDPACEAANPTEPARCLYGDVWYPHVSALAPVLVQQSTVDAVFTREHAIDNTMPNPTLAAWRMTVESSLATPAWLFAGGIPYHTLATSDQGITRGPAGSTLAQVLQQFWGGAAPRRVVF